MHILISSDDLCNLIRWKEERRRHFPTAANLAHREAEAAARREAGGLDPKAQERRQRLKEILERQKALGLDRWVEGAVPGIQVRSRVSGRQMTR